MKAMIDNEVERPIHPDQDPEVQAAKAAWLEADRAAVNAERRHKDNHHQLVAASDDVDRWRAQANQPRL